MNLVMESNFGMNILIGSGTRIISRFDSIYLLSPGEGRNTVVNIKKNLYSISCGRPEESRWLGGSFWNPWNAMNEHGFCSILRPVLEQTFLFALRNSPSSTAILKYIMKNPGCANWENKNILLIAPIESNEGLFHGEFLVAVESARKMFDSVIELEPGCIGQDRTYVYNATVNALDQEIWKKY